MASAGEPAPAAADSGPAWYRHLYGALGHIGGAILAVMTLAVFVQVILRYLGLVGIDGLEEIPRFLFVWLVMIGAAAAMARGEHTVLDYFVGRMPLRLRLLVALAMTGCTIALFVWLVKLSLVLVPNAQLQSSAGLDLPLGYVYAAIPVGSVLIILPLLRLFWTTARQLWPKPS